MIFEIGDSEELLARIRGINDWIDANKEIIGNANMYEIIACMLARNNIRVLEGRNDLLDAEIERMISLRSESIREFQSDVPESVGLFEAVRDGLVVDNMTEMDFVCKCQSISFFINNVRRRGTDGDIAMPLEVQERKANPGYEHSNMTEIRGLVSYYENASDEVKAATYPVARWIADNLVPELRERVELQQPMVEDSFGF